MAQIQQCIIFLAMNQLNFELFEKKTIGATITQKKFKKQILKPWYLLYGSKPRGPRDIKRFTGTTQCAIWGLAQQYYLQIEECSKYSKKTDFFFFSILMIFWSFYPLGAISTVLFVKENLIFWHLWEPWKCVHIYLNNNSAWTSCVITYLHLTLLHKTKHLLAS